LPMRNLYFANEKYIKENQTPVPELPAVYS